MGLKYNQYQFGQIIGPKVKDRFKQMNRA
jgi:hypothetical protein